MLHGSVGDGPGPGPGVVPLFIMNVADTLLPAASLTMSVYVPFVETIDPFVNDNPLSVAIAQVRLSLKVMVTSFVYVVPLVMPKY